MPDINLTVGNTVGNALYDRPRVGCIAKLISAAEQGTLLTTNAYQAVNVAANYRVLHVQVKILTPDTGASARTVNVGDGATPAGYLAAIDMKAAAGTLYTSTLTLTEAAPPTFGYTNGKLYTVADTIDVVPLQVLTNAVFRVSVIFLDLEP